MDSVDPFLGQFQELIEKFMHRSVRGMFRYSKRSGLGMSQIGALFHISRVTGGVSDLGDELGVTNAAASQMLDRLVQQGLILRSEDPADRRRIRIELTAKGRQALEESVDARQDWLKGLAAALSPAEREQILAAVTILIQKIDQLK